VRVHEHLVELWISLERCLSDESDTEGRVREESADIVVGDFEERCDCVTERWRDVRGYGASRTGTGTGAGRVGDSRPDRSEL
jgi:hypothetical protein